MSTSQLAPVALFAWRRPSHLKAVISSLSRNPGASSTDLHVFVDGPKNEGDIPLIERVLEVIEAAEGFRSVDVRASTVNRGLSGSITAGINALLEASETVIVLEDDIVVAPSFLTYMNEHLHLYADEERVASIHAYVYPHNRPLPDTFFVRGADCWGWGTWRRAWEQYQPDGKALLRELEGRGLSREFDLGGAAPFTEMLRDQVAGRNDSWAVRWHASAFLAEMLTLYPDLPLALNIGHDGSGTHRGSSSRFDGELSDKPVKPVRIPIAEFKPAVDAFAAFFQAQRRLPRGRLGTWTRRVLLPIWRHLPVGVRRLLS